MISVRSYPGETTMKDFAISLALVVVYTVVLLLIFDRSIFFG